MSKKIVIGAIVGCMGLIVIIGLAYGLAYGLNDSKKVAQPTAEQLKSFNGKLMACWQVWYILNLYIGPQNHF